MKIEQTGSSNQILRTEQKKADSVKKDTVKKGSAESVNMAFSESARLLSRARVALNESPEVRQDVVDELRQKILMGDYEVSYTELAEKLLSLL